MQIVWPYGVRDRRDDDQIRRVLQGDECLGAQGMALHHLDFDAPGIVFGPRIAAKYAYNWHAAFGADIDVSQVVKPFGGAVVNHDPLRAIGLYDIAEMREGYLG